MLKIPRFFHARQLVAVAALAALVSCSGGGCGNCTIPPFNGGVPSNGAVTGTPPPGVALVPIIPGVTVPGPVATPGPVVATLAPGATAAAAPLTCAQNASTGSGVPLGTAATFAVLAGSTVTNTGPTIVTGDLGVSPGTAITGFTGIAPGGPGTVVGGSIHSADPVAAQAQLDLTTAYNNAAGRASTASVAGDIGGRTLAPGVYTSTSSLGITGAVTLDGQNNPNSVFIFQIASTLTTAANNSAVVLINGANACNVFWQVGSSATIGTASVFNGTVMALASITMNTGAASNGRLLARTAAVTMQSNIVTKTGP